MNEWEIILSDKAGGGLLIFAGRKRVTNVEKGARSARLGKKEKKKKKEEKEP